MLLQHKQVAIIGAGPVGLTLARLLQQKGVIVTVYERDTDTQARIRGGTLDLHSHSGQQAMKQAGLRDRYFALAKPMGRTLTDEQGNVLFTREPQPDNPEINRNVLRTLLLDSLASNTVIWNHRYIGLEEGDEKWLLHFDKQETAIADVVIGANGGMSGVRAFVTDAEPEYTGTFIIQGEVSQPKPSCPAFYQRCAGNILMTANDGNLLVANPDNNGALTYAVMFATSEEWVQKNSTTFLDTNRAITYLSERFSHWHESYRELFCATDSFWGLPTRQLPLEKPWNVHRPLPITLIGDAAHLMPPFAGQGVNTGLMDALVLSENLTNGRFATIQAAIHDYEQQMAVYASEAQRESRQNELSMRDPGFSFRQLFH